MRKIILSVISTLVLIGLLFGGLLWYVRGTGFSAREQPTWMEKMMAHNARKIATPAGAKNFANTRQQQTAEMIAEADEHFVEHCGISNGIRLTGMPAWGSEDKPEAIWDLVGLIRRLPKLSREELQRLQNAAREAGGELSEQAPENEKKEGDEASKASETKPKHTHTHTHKH